MQLNALATVCRRSQAQSYWSFDCTEARRNHSSFLHDVNQAVVRQLLGNLPGERHEPAPICASTIAILSSGIPRRALNVLTAICEPADTVRPEAARYLAGSASCAMPTRSKHCQHDVRYLLTERRRAW